MNKLLIAIPILSLLTVGFMFSSHKQSTVNYEDWQNCWSNHKDSDPCTNTKEFNLTNQQFMQLTYGYADIDIEASVECQSFQNHKLSIEIYGLELNFNNYYEKCFFSPQVQSIVNSNSCFKTQYFNPIFVKCAGF